MGFLIVRVRSAPDPGWSLEVGVPVAANMVTLFKLIAAENRLLAFVTRRRATAASMSQCCALGSLSIVKMSRRTRAPSRGEPP